MQPPQKRQHEFATAEKQHECHAPGMRAKARGNHADNAPPSRPRTAPAKAGTRHVAPRPLRRRSPDEVQGPHTHPASKSRIGGAASASVIGVYIYETRVRKVPGPQAKVKHAYGRVLEPWLSPSPSDGLHEGDVGQSSGQSSKETAQARIRRTSFKVQSASCTSHDLLMFKCAHCT